MKLSTKLFLAASLMIIGALLFAIGLVTLSFNVQTDYTDVSALEAQSPLIPLLVYFLPSAFCMVVGGRWHQNILVAKDKARTEAFIKSLN